MNCTEIASVDVFLCLSGHGILLRSLLFERVQFLLRIYHPLLGLLLSIL